jgi:hypothetical protein
MFSHWMHRIAGVKSNTGRICANLHVSACGIGAPPVRIRVRVHSRQVVEAVVVEAVAGAGAGVVAVAIMTPSGKIPIDCKYCKHIYISIFYLLLINKVFGYSIYKAILKIATIFFFMSFIIINR